MDHLHKDRTLEFLLARPFNATASSHSVGDPYGSLSALGFLEQLNTTTEPWRAFFAPIEP